LAAGAGNACPVEAVKSDESYAHCNHQTEIMSKRADWLQDHRADIFSQCGEDGVIEKILDILPATDSWCVEFGALDGKALSNTRNLIESKGYSAVLIEASTTRFKQLQSNFSHNNRVTAINQFVGFDAHDNLDSILSNTAIPINFDFLSIDIDGNDYYVWKAISRYEPKVVCIEFNNTIPNEISFVQAADRRINQGSSLRKLIELGKEKGYELISVVGVNALFVQAQYFQLFDIPDNSIDQIRTDLSAITYLFVGYDGTIFLSGQKSLPWHLKMPIVESKIQQLPRLLRKFPENYNKVEMALAGLYLFTRHPRAFVAAVKKRYFDKTRP
jgi:hypothetical protein